MHILNAQLSFPPVEHAGPEGLLAIGGDLRCERLLLAYRNGIFPWYNVGQPILWWSPDPRTVLFPEKLKISRSLRKTLRAGAVRVSLDQAFEQVMRACAAPRRKDPDGGTWITSEMIAAYSELHRRGYAHSVEVWQGEELVGGLYGVAIGKAFFGESMFSRINDASKIALVYLVRQLAAWNFGIIDCQQKTAHLLSLGAEEIPRTQFMALVRQCVDANPAPGPWVLEIDQNIDSLTA